MLIDTHCHINMMVKKEFDRLLTDQELFSAKEIILEATKHNVSKIINVGTSLPESINCIELAKKYPSCFAVTGIHPNDCSILWKEDIKKLEKYLKNKEKNKIIGIGECGIDKHYPDFNLQRQKDAFRAQIELALTYNLALVIHSRDAYDETLQIIEEYVKDLQREGCARTIMHCFSYDKFFANKIIEWNFHLGIGGTITYPKNNELRNIVETIDLKHIVLETDAPFLPPQQIRGQQNHPLHIQTIAKFIGQLRNEELQNIAEVIEKNVKNIFLI